MDPATGLEYQETRSYLDGYAAGVRDAMSCAKQLRLSQIARKPVTAPPQPATAPKEETNDAVAPV
jgi:hypothetical protein